VDLQLPFSILNIDEILIPRVRKIGGVSSHGSCGKAMGYGVGEVMSAGCAVIFIYSSSLISSFCSYGQFLAPLLQSNKNWEDSTTRDKPVSAGIAKSSEDGEVRDRDADSSMLGQASAPLEQHSAEGRYDDDVEIRQLYTQTSAPLSIQDLDDIVSDPKDISGRDKPPPHPHDFIRDEPLFDDEDIRKAGQDGLSSNKDKKAKNNKYGSVGALIPGMLSPS
jgi:hypothetical protein